MKKQKNKKDPRALDLPVVLDSGAHSLYTAYVLKRGKKGLGSADTDAFDWYDTQEFFDYVDTYCDVVKTGVQRLEWFASVDVIFNPQKTWEVYQYIRKKHGLIAMPVIHFGTDMKWIQKYVEEDDLEFIGIGGLGQEATAKAYSKWADDVFTILGDSDGKPRKKAHGFAVTSFSLMRRYPWFSVDSTSWLQYAMFGCILVPYTVRGEYDYTRDPYKVFVSDQSPTRSEQGKHIDSMDPASQAVVLQYLSDKGMSLESLQTTWEARSEANGMYFLDLVNSMPKWPWSFKPATMKGLMI